MSGTIKNRVGELIAVKEREDGVSISYRHIEEATGMSKNTISDWVNNRVKRYDSDKLVTWCDYFGCDITDLLIYVRDEE